MGLRSALRSDGADPPLQVGVKAALVVAGAALLWVDTDGFTAGTFDPATALAGLAAGVGAGLLATVVSGTGDRRVPEPSGTAGQVLLGVVLGLVVAAVVGTGLVAARTVFVVVAGFVAVDVLYTVVTARRRTDDDGPASR